MERVREGSIAIDDSQVLEVARQVVTRLYTIRIDHSVHDDFVCNFLLDDLVINCGSKLDVNHIARGPVQARSLDCFTHAMVDDSGRMLPRSVLEDDTIIVSCGLANFARDDVVATTNYVKFLAGFEHNYSEVCNDRSVWMMIVESSTIPTKTRKRGSKGYHELHSRLYDDMSRFFTG